MAGTENKQGYLRNTLDLASPFLKVGTNPVNPQAFSQIANYYRQLKGKGQPILDALPFVANVTYSIKFAVSFPPATYLVASAQEPVYCVPVCKSPN